MIYSKLYKKYYPFESCAAVMSLTQDEKGSLIYYIKHYPGHLSDKMLNSRRYGIQVEGWERPEGWGSCALPSIGLVDVLLDLQKKCNELITKIERAQPLADSDIANINRILYSHKYCLLLSWFFCPTPDGHVSAVLL